MALYGRTTQGAGWLEFEFRRTGRKITLSGTETAVGIHAYIRSQGTATNGTRAVLYDSGTSALAYQSDVLAGFTDTVGQWRTYTFGSSVAAGDYWLTIFAEGISGGGNTVQVANDVVAADANLYERWFNDGTVWPSQSASLTGLAEGDNVNNISLYLETSSGASQAPRSSAFLRMLMNN